MKVRFRIWLAAVACLVCVFALSACSAVEEQTDEQTQNRQYMSSVSTIMSTLEGNMEEFAEAVKGGEVISLDAQLSAVDQAVSDLDSLEVPEAMQDIHSSYTNGAKELQTALTMYVQLYEDVEAPASGSFDYSTYDARLAEVQSHYDAGIAALQDADTKVQDA